MYNMTQSAWRWHKIDYSGHVPGLGDGGADTERYACRYYRTSIRRCIHGIFFSHLHFAARPVLPILPRLI